MRNYTPNPIIIARAVELWKRALAAPIYQNEAPEHQTPQMRLAATVAASMKKNNTPDVLDRFGAVLQAMLMNPIDKNGRYEEYLQTDYGPCSMLADAATAAGLKMEFPWKTRMSITETYVDFSMGYGARSAYHYPLSGGRWLITDLRGVDIDKIIAMIERGDDAGFTIEG